MCDCSVDLLNIFLNLQPQLKIDLIHLCIRTHKHIYVRTHFLQRSSINKLIPSGIGCCRFSKIKCLFRRTEWNCENKLQPNRRAKEFDVLMTKMKLTTAPGQASEAKQSKYSHPYIVRLYRKQYSVHVNFYNCITSWCFGGMVEFSSQSHSRIHVFELYFSPFVIVPESKVSRQREKRTEKNGDEMKYKNQFHFVNALFSLNITNVNEKWPFHINSQ